MGVFLFYLIPFDLFPGLPHVRGGVSRSIAEMAWKIQSSPRAWGCFPEIIGDVIRLMVFPTCVGVFLLYLVPFDLFPGLPHVRGGVSWLCIC